MSYPFKHISILIIFYLETLVHDLLRQVLESDTPDIKATLSETCIICSEDLEFTNVESGTCASGHSFSKRIKSLH